MGSGFASLLITMALGACRPPRASSQCADLYAGGNYAMALTVCEQDFVSARRADAGLVAARAAFRLGRHDLVLEWPKRLSGAPEAGTAWVLAGIVREQLKDDDRAKQAYLSAVGLHRAAGDAKKASDALYRLFHLSWRTSAHRDAFMFATDAYEEAAKIDDRAQQLIALEALFAALYEIGDLEGARQILLTTETIIAPDDRPARARLLLNRGAVFIGESRPAMARTAFEDALQLAATTDSVFLIRLRLNLVEAALLSGNLDDAERQMVIARRLADAGAADQNRNAALAFYQSWLDYGRGRYADAAQAATVALRDEPIPEWRWALQFRLGLAEEAGRRDGAAQAAYQRAIEIVESLRGSVDNDEFKDWLGERRRAPFEALFGLTARRRDFAAALHIAEQAKARAFNDAFIHNASADEGRTDGRGKWSVDLASDRLETLSSVLPATANSVVAPLPATRQIIAAVADRHVLAYFLAGDTLWLLKVARGSVDARPLGHAADIERLAELFVGRQDDIDLAAALGERLLPQNWLPVRGATIYIVPDRALGTVPFAALLVNHRRFVEDHSISYLPSISALGALESVPPRPAAGAVVIGDPRGDLPGAHAEAQWVASHLGVSARTGSAATQRALADASDGGLLHIAAHTWLAPGGPWLGLSDGRVTTSAIMREHIRPSIAVLASCSSAATRGAGYWGSWGAAFLASGTRSVIAALWSVDDAQSREFIVRFYEEGGAVDPAGALTKTQRAFIDAGRPPSFWAPFVHMGIASRSPLAGSD